MKDIDFDELDKAVNSLMATAPPSSGSTADDAKPENTLEVSSGSPITVSTSTASTGSPVVVDSAESVEVVSTPTVVVPTAAPEVSASPVAPSTPVAPAVKRTGRFMDMVHTSSDMKPRAVSTPPSREGLSITPRSDSAAPAAAASAPVEQTPPSVSEPSPEPKTPDIMPDPIDLGSAADAFEAEPATTEPTVPATSSVPGESPFIADAKVEKRPLNPGATSPESESFDTQFANELGTDKPDEPAESPAPEEQAADEPPATPQIPELSSDLVAIESSDKVEEPVVTQSVDTKDAASAVDAPAAPLGATSIAKQYKPQASTGDQSHAAIYDASQYPEPIAHPAKKKAGWLWVLWVVLLLGVGAGAAALLYFLGIIP